MKKTYFQFYPGINYYEDENWLSHVPEGVLSESKEDLVTKIYDQRRLSRLGDASVSMQELSTSLPPGQREKVFVMLSYTFDLKNVVRKKLLKRNFFFN